MVPWVERPTIELDLDALGRGVAPTVPAAAVTAGRELLAEVMTTIPPKARLLAYAIALRTGNRFGAEFRAAANLIAADPRDVALANISYDLVIGSVGCSTVALPTPDGPAVARNMDWWPEGPLARASYLLRCNRGVAV